MGTVPYHESTTLKHEDITTEETNQSFFDFFVSAIAKSIIIGLLVVICIMIGKCFQEIRNQWPYISVQTETQ